MGFTGCSIKKGLFIPSEMKRPFISEREERRMEERTIHSKNERSPHRASRWTYRAAAKVALSSGEHGSDVCKDTRRRAIRGPYAPCFPTAVSSVRPPASLPGMGRATRAGWGQDGRQGVFFKYAPRAAALPPAGPTNNGDHGVQYRHGSLPQTKPILCRLCREKPHRRSGDTRTNERGVSRSGRVPAGRAAGR